MFASRHQSQLRPRAAEARPLEIADHEPQLGMALAEDLLGLGEIEHRRLETGDGGPAGGVRAGAAADVEQRSTPRGPGELGQSGAEPRGEVVEGAEEGERLGQLVANSGPRQGGIRAWPSVTASGRPAQTR